MISFRYREQQERYRDFLDRLKRRQSRPFNEPLIRKPGRFKRFLGKWTSWSPSSSPSRSRDRGRRKKEETDEEVENPEELTALLWQNWYESVANYSQIVTKVSDIQLEETNREKPGRSGSLPG